MNGQHFFEGPLRSSVSSHLRRCHERGHRVHGLGPDGAQLHIHEMTVQDRLPGSVIHTCAGIAAGVFLLSAGGGSSWRCNLFSIVLISAALNWWAPTCSASVRGKSIRNLYAGIQPNASVLPRIADHVVVPDLQHMLIHASVLLSCILSWVSLLRPSPPSIWRPRIETSGHERHFFGTRCNDHSARPRDPARCRQGNLVGTRVRYRVMTRSAPSDIPNRMATTTTEVEEDGSSVVPAPAAGPAEKPVRRFPKLPWLASRLCFAAGSLLPLHVVFRGVSWLTWLVDAYSTIFFPIDAGSIGLVAFSSLVPHCPGAADRLDHRCCGRRIVVLGDALMIVRIVSSMVSDSLPSECLVMLVQACVNVAAVGALTAS